MAVNYKFTLEYHGADFHGWQCQQGVQTVQGVLEKALEAVTQEKCTVFGAGRTDRGVHALGQVAHVLLPTSFCLDRLRRGTNFYLKEHRVRVVSVQQVTGDFHARFSAVRRCYRYRVLVRPSVSPLCQDQVWWVPRPLDLQAMQQAATFFEGTHDFSAFRGRFCQAKSPLKTLEACEVQACGDEVHVVVRARSFLHHQVRIMVGTLVEVGRGDRLPTFVQTLLQQKKRGTAGVTAPAQGLCLEAVCYD